MILCVLKTIQWSLNAQLLYKLITPTHFVCMYQVLLNLWLFSLEGAIISPHLIVLKWIWASCCWKTTSIKDRLIGRSCAACWHANQVSSRKAPKENFPPLQVPEGLHKHVPNLLSSASPLKRRRLRECLPESSTDVKTPGAGVLSIWTLKHPHFLPWDWNAISNLMSFVLWPNSDIGRPQKSLVPILSHDLPHTLDPSTLTFHGAVPFRWGLICGVPTQQVPSPLLKAGGHWACWKRRLSVAFRGKVKGLRHTVGAPDTLHCPSHTPWENPYHYLRRHSKHIG